MAQLAAMNLTDGEATPVVHPVLPVSIKPGEIIWRENLPTVPVTGQVVLKFKSVTPTNTNGVYKEIWTVETPILEATSGNNAAGYTAAPKVAHTPRADIVFYFHTRSTSQQRKNVRKMAFSLDFSVQYQEAVDLLMFPY